MPHAFMCLDVHLFHEWSEQKITGGVEEKVLDPKAHNGEHGKTAVVEFLLLVVHPARIGIVHKLGRTEKVAGLVRGVLLNLQSEKLKEADEHKYLVRVEKMGYDGRGG